MKIQLDTDNKTIKLENEVQLSKLVETLERLLPNGEWKEFTLQTNTTITHWHEPFVIERYREPYYYPWYSSKPTYMGVGIDKQYTMLAKESAALSLKAGSYNIEV